MVASGKLGLVLGSLRKMWDVLGDHRMPLLVLWGGSVTTGVWGAQGRSRTPAAETPASAAVLSTSSAVTTQIEK